MARRQVSYRPEHLLDQCSERRVVSLKLASGVDLVVDGAGGIVQVEPRLNPFRPILIRIRCSVGIRPKTGIQRVSVGSLETLAKFGATWQQLYAHVEDAVGKLMHEDVLEREEIGIGAQKVLLSNRYNGADNCWSNSTAPSPLIPVNVGEDFIQVAQFGKFCNPRGRCHDSYSNIVLAELRHDVRTTTQHLVDETLGLPKSSISNTRRGDDRQTPSIEIFAVEGIESELSWRCSQWFRTCIRLVHHDRRGHPVHTSAGNDLGVDIEPAAVDIEQRLLVLDEPISHLDVVLGGARRSNSRRDRNRGGTLSGNHICIHIEQAPIGVEEILLVDRSGGPKNGVRPDVLELVPDCACDACDSGSQIALDVLDEYVICVVTGTYRKLWRGGREITVYSKDRMSWSGFDKRRVSLGRFVRGRLMTSQGIPDGRPGRLRLRRFVGGRFTASPTAIPDDYYTTANDSTHQLKLRRLDTLRRAIANKLRRGGNRRNERKKTEKILARPKRWNQIHGSSWLECNDQQ